MYKTNGSWQKTIINNGDPSVIIIDKVCPTQQQNEPTVGKPRQFLPHHTTMPISELSINNK